MTSILDELREQCVRAIDNDKNVIVAGTMDGGRDAGRDDETRRMSDNETMEREGGDETMDETRERNDDDECSHMTLLLRSFSRSRFDFPIKHENKNTAKIIGFLFILRPTPSRQLSSTRRPHIVPRPRGVGCAGVSRVAVSGRRAGLFAYSLGRAAHSAIARSLLLSDPQAGEAIAMCAVFVSSFSCVIR